MLRCISRGDVSNEKITEYVEESYILIGAEDKEPRYALEYNRIPEREDAEDVVAYIFSANGKEREREIALVELLCDEGYSNMPICISPQAFHQCGGLNLRLPGGRQKQIYELLLRMSRTGRVCLLPMQMVSEDEVFSQGIQSGGSGEEQEQSENTEFHWEAFQADCYVAAKYQRQLAEAGVWEAVLQTLVSMVQGKREEQQGLSWLGQMLAHEENYWKIEDGVAPILIYLGVTYCYNILNVIAESFGQALERMGQIVEYYDEQQEDVAGLGRYCGRRYKAVIGVQSYLFSVYLKNSGRYLHDEIIGPKYNFILDHPLWLKEQLQHVPKDYYVLTHDENYRQFIETYFPTVKKTFLFPPGGIEAQLDTQESLWVDKRSYGVTFVGTYGDYRVKCKMIKECVPEVRRLAMLFLKHLRRQPNLTAEASFSLALEDMGMRLTGEEFLQLFFEMRSVVQCIMYYFREKVVRTLLEHGIEVHVWGDTWKNSPLASHSLLHIHTEVVGEESLKELRQSKVSLNVMAWHKGGFTERMANSMLAGAVVVTDRTTYGAEEGREIPMVQYDLENLQRLPEQVQKVLQDDTYRDRIARQAYAYAKENHSWDCRAKQLLEVLDEGNG